MFLTFGCSLVGGLVASVLGAFGISVAFVEKGDDFPVKFFRDHLNSFLQRFSNKMTGLLDCTVCFSFWAALLCDIFLFIVTGGAYFAWPLSGFAALGVTWLIYEIMALKDKEIEAMKSTPQEENPSQDKKE